MKPTKLFAAIWALLALQLSGCATIVTMESVRPPAVRVAPDQWKVLVVNRFDAAQTQTKNKQVIDVLREGAYQAAGGAMGAIYNDSTFVLVNPDMAVELLSSPASTRLSQTEVRELYTTYQPHLILALDKFDASFGRDVSSYEDEFGFQSRTTNFDLIVASTWSLYDSTGAVVDHSIMQQEEFYDVRAVATGAALPTAAPAINRLAVETGYRFWDRLYPQPVLLVRQLHQGRALNDAVFMLQTQQFQKAINVLLPIAQDASARQSTKAAHNLAVAYEAAGNYEQAIHWARQAEGRGDRLAVNLIELWTGAGIIK
jgi:hypothetical protein